jgi:hypothetical protein
MTACSDDPAPTDPSAATALPAPVSFKEVVARIL